ncbi:MAG: pyridoxal phosphate-dependent aminotransferase [Actinomycetota bacterium]
MTVRLRSSLAALPAYVPGRTVPGAIKLASNETPYPVLPHVLSRLAEAAVNANRYPDASCALLTAALAEKYAVPTDRVSVGCGSVALCQQLVQIAAGSEDEVVYGWRAFEAYPIVTAVVGARGVPVPLRDHVHDLTAMADSVTDRTRLIFLCNPNNPTGTAVRRGELAAFLQAVPADVVVALDEAYREFVTDPDVPDGLTFLDAHPNVIVLRTFSKAHGLAGLRVGYGIAGDPAITTALKQVQLPFAVSQVAQQAALASLEPEAEKQLLERVDVVVAERHRVAAELSDMGYGVPPTQANFVWLPLGEATTDWANACADRGLIVRPFAGDGARVTISTAEENDRFLDAARALAG